MASYLFVLTLFCFSSHFLRSLLFKPLSLRCPSPAASRRRFNPTKNNSNNNNNNNNNNNIKTKANRIPKSRRPYRIWRRASARQGPLRKDVTNKKKGPQKRKKEKKMCHRESPLFIGRRRGGSFLLLLCSQRPLLVNVNVIGGRLVSSSVVGSQ